MAGDLSNEAVSAVLNATETGSDSLMSLLHYLITHKERSMKANQSDQKLEYSGTTDDQKQLGGSSGYQRAKLLYQSNEKLQPANISLSSRELNRFDYYAKLMDFTYTTVSNKKPDNNIKLLNDKVNDLRADRILIYRAKDQVILRDIIDRMNLDHQMERLNKNYEILSARTDKSYDNTDRLSQLEAEKEAFIRKDFNKFNEENAKIICEGTEDKNNLNALLSERAINRNINRALHQEKPYYICERTDPDNYIELKSYIQKEKGQIRERTDYRIFLHGVEQTDKQKIESGGQLTNPNPPVDGRTGDRANDWTKLKKELKEKGCLNNDLVAFHSKTELEQYQKRFKALLEKSTPKEHTIGVEIDHNSYRDYVGIINQLKGQLDNHNIELNEERQICRKGSKEVIHLDRNMTDDEKLAYLEHINVAKQIANYELLNKNQVELAMVQQQLSMNENSYHPLDNPNSEYRSMYEKMQNDLNEKANSLRSSQEVYTEKEYSLKQERNQLFGIQIVRQIDKEFSKVKDYERSSHIHEQSNQKEEMGIQDNPDHIKSMEKWKQQISNNRETRQGSGTSRNTNTKTIPKKDER